MRKFSPLILLVASLLAFAPVASSQQKVQTPVPTPATFETLPLPVAQSVLEPATPGFVIKKAITNVGQFTQVGPMLLVDESASPELANVGYLSLPGTVDASTVVAEDVNRNPVDVTKIDESRWLVLGTGRIIIMATIATKEPFSLSSLRYDVVIPKLSGPDPKPEPDVPEPDVPEPNVPADRFDNLGQRVSALCVSIPLAERKVIADIYRTAADKLSVSVEASAISKNMTTARDTAIAASSNKALWQPVLALISSDFTSRRADMVREDVVAHWSAIASGLDPK